MIVDINTREQAKVQAWSDFKEKTPSIIEVPNWDTLTPRQKKTAVSHINNMNSLI
tara:strand:+ start:1495 stop:1659 length:165 start_codon:yes stop_codon:yes gene_type:complete